MNDVIQTSVDPTTALSVGLKVDADALPAGFLDGADLHSPATTLELIRHDAVVGVKGTIETVNGTATLTSVGVTCALCHSTVDNSVASGIGHRLDGWPNRDLNVGAIVALSPALTDAQKAVYNSWGPGRYDPRYNIDGQNSPVLIPPAYGLKGTKLETYTGDGPISYWNAYVAVTQMHGQGTFVDPRIGVNVVQTPDLVTPKLPDLLAYQLSLQAPAPPSGSYDRAAAGRGRGVFQSVARCAQCHPGNTYTDDALHTPAEVGQEPVYAARSATKLYRSTPLRALWQHAPYFHDGNAHDLNAVVAHYETVLGIHLTDQQKSDLIEFLKSI